MSLRMYGPHSCGGLRSKATFLQELYYCHSENHCSLELCHKLFLNDKKVFKTQKRRHLWSKIGKTDSELLFLSFSHPGQANPKWKEDLGSGLHMMALRHSWMHLLEGVVTLIVLSFAVCKGGRSGQVYLLSGSAPLEVNRTKPGLSELMWELIQDW